MKKNILITGGLGLLGKTLVKFLSKKNIMYLYQINQKIKKEIN